MRDRAEPRESKGTVAARRFVPRAHGREHGRDGRGTSSVAASPRSIHVNQRGPEICEGSEFFFPPRESRQLFNLTPLAQCAIITGYAAVRYTTPCLAPLFPSPLCTVRQRAPRQAI